MNNRIELFISKKLISKTIAYSKVELTIVDIILISIITIMSILFSSLLVYKHSVYATYAWDLGIFAQILKSTLEGNFMYHTPQLYVIPNGNHMFIHFTPILLLLLPIYAIAPYATTLLVIKPIITFAAAYPLYLIGKKLSDQITAFLVAILYMLYPLLHGALTFDFQFSIFLPLLTFLAIYAYITNKKILYLISIGLLTLVSEQGALYALMLSIIHLIPYLLNRIKRISNYISWLFINNTKISFKLILLSLMIISIYYISLTYFLEYAGDNYVIKETRDIIRASGNFAMLNYTGNKVLLPLYIITHPSETFTALQWEYNIKLVFIMLVYGILAFLPLQSIYGLLSIPIISTFLVSNFSPYYKIGPHYPYYYVGFILVGFAIIVANIKMFTNRIRILFGILIATLLILISVAPWSPFSEALLDSGLIWYTPIPSEKDPRFATLDNFVEIANKENEKGASLLVQNHVFPHTTMNSNVYVLPPHELYPFNSTYFDNYIRNLINISDIILLDLQNEQLVHLVLEFAKDDFGVYAEANDILLLKKGYNDKPINFNVDCGNMLHGPDTTVNNNIISLSKGKEGRLVYGPYRFLTQGTYVVTYEMRAKDIDTLGEIAIVDVVSDLGSSTYAKRIVSGYELDGQWTKIKLEFTINEFFKDNMEFRVYSLGNSDIEFKSCSIEKLDNVPNINIVNIAFSAKELKYSSGFMNNTLVTLPSHVKTDLFWYTQPIKLNYGVYVAEIYLKIEPEIAHNDNVISVDITNGGEVITSMALGKDNLTYIGDGWYIARLPFILTEHSGIEIIGKEPNSNYTIAISHINITTI